MDELIKGIPLEPEEKDAAFVLDELDRLFGQTVLWSIGIKSGVPAAASRYALQRSSIDQPLLWASLYAFAIGFMAGIHHESARRRKKAER